MKKIVVFLGLTLFLHGMIPMYVQALSCAEPPKAEEAVHDYDAVAVAIITDVKENFAYKAVKADVITPIKGIEEKTISFQEDRTWGESEIKKEYLLFLNRSGNSFSSPLCSPTREMNGLDHETLVHSLIEATKNSKPAPVPTTETSKNEPDKSPDGMMRLVILSCVLSAGIVGTILYQTKKKK